MDCGPNTDVNPELINDDVKAVAVVWPMKIWYTPMVVGVPREVTLNAILVRLPGCTPAALSSAAVYRYCNLAAFAPVRYGDVPNSVVAPAPICTVPGPPLILVAWSTLLPPTQIFVGVAVTVLITGFGFTVTVMVAELVHPLGNPSFATTVYVVVLEGLAVTTAEFVLLNPFEGDQVKLVYEGSLLTAASSPTLPPLQYVVEPEGVMTNAGGGVTVTVTAVRSLSQVPSDSDT